MRLRLTVRRNGVPEVKLMWNVEADADLTISRLLSNVNDVVPLESTEWGLDDYAVEYRDGEDGFECLHFQLVKDILKENDQVLIRPLLTNDLRRRRLSGRHQITADGRHLVDGVAFGRPWLRAPANRPGIELPPRKRARISYHLNGDENANAPASVDSTPTSEDDDYSYASPVDTSEDEERLLLEAPKDSDEAPGTVVGEGYVNDGTSNLGDSTLTPEDAVKLRSLRDDSPPLPAYPGEAEPSSAARRQTLSSILNTIHGKNTSAPANRGRAHAVQKSDSSDSSDDSSSEGSSNASDSGASKSSSGSDTDSDGSSDSDSSNSEEEASVPLGSMKQRPMGDSSQTSDSGSTSGPSEEDVKGRGSRSVADGASSESSESDDSSDSSDSSSDSSVESEARKQVVTPAPLAPKPAPQEPKPVATGVAPLTKSQKRNIRKREARRHRAALAQGEAGGASPATGTGSQDDEVTKRRLALLESLEGHASPAVTPKKPKTQVEETVSKSGEQNDRAPQSAKGQDSATSQRSKGFDFGAPGRLLFGALGFGGSKNREEEQLPDSQTSGHNEVPREEGSKAPEDSDEWKDKINYRAVECVREGVELSEPPFPFVQRWDPQQRVDVWYGNNKRGGKGKRKQRNQAHYYEDDTGHGKKRKTSPWPELLQYDEDANMGEGVDDELGQDNAQDSYGAPDDLPALPEDLNTLPRLFRGEATVGMVITWKQWLLSKATNWEPRFENVTGVVVRLDESDPDALYVLLAKRDRNLDRNEKEYDPQTGQRIYGGFEAPDLDEEEGEGSEDEDGRLVSFAEMMEPRVVQKQSVDWLSAIPDSLQQNGQGETNFEPLSIDLQVPLSTDPPIADGTSEAEQPAPSDLAEGNSQRNGLDLPSAVSSVASGRRQPDPNSLPASIEFDMVIPDSGPEPPGKAKIQGIQGRNSRRGSVQRAQGPANDTNSPAKGKARQVEISGSQSPIPDAPAEKIKPAGRDQSFFEMEDEYLPKKLRREANGLAAVKKEADREADGGDDGVIDLKKEASPPRLVFPDSSPPRMGSQKDNGPKKRKDRTSPFELPEGSQVIDLVSEGDNRVGTPVSSQKQKNGTPHGQSQNGTPRSSQKQNSTPASQRRSKSTPASQKKGSQKSDSLPKGPGWVKKRKGWKAETAI